MDAPIIEIQGLYKTYGMLPVLRGLDLDIARGSCLALLGPNGSGKSTLIKLLSGLSRADRGVIRVGGWELPREAAHIRAQIGLVSHKSLLYESLTARENLRFFARLYNIPQAEREARINELLIRVGLQRRDVDVVRTFSRGMQQRLSIARALLHDPHIILLDEPYTGLDQEAAAMLDTVVGEARRDGHTIVMVTHELERAARLAERIVILYRGVIAFDSPTAILTATHLVAEYARITGQAKKPVTEAETEAV